MDSDAIKGHLTGPVIRRLSEYLLILDKLIIEEKEVVSSRELANNYGNNASQVRQDMFHLHHTGAQSHGYETRELRAAIADALGLNVYKRLAILGVGNLGRAIAMHVPFEDYGMKLVAAFDIDKNLSGSSISGVPVYHTDNIQKVIKKEEILLTALCVPAEVAQQSANQVISAGVCGILNYSRTRLKVPKHVAVHYEQIICSFMQLSCQVQHKKS